MTQASGRFLPDTNIIIALFSGDEEVLEKLTQAFEVFIPAVVIGELYFGAAKSHKRDENIARIEELIVSQQIVACDVAVAREYGRLKEGLKRLGRPVPENDIWIAATARHHGLTLVTRDRHFENIDNLPLTPWSATAP